MNTINKCLTSVLFGTILGAFALPGHAQSESIQPALQPEPVMQVATLPEDYPKSWLFAHDANFHSLIAGRIEIMDAAAETKEYKGALGAAQFASFIESSALPELYVAETFYARGTRGQRTDVVTVYDKSTLMKTSEIVLPGNKRMQAVTNKHTLRLIDDDRFLLVFNFTPASSVTIIDTQSKKILSELNVPGCTMIYPNGPRGFSSLCGNGSMVSIQFDVEGNEISRIQTAPFFDVDKDPVFDKPAYIDDVAYFVSYLGNIMPVDMSKAKPKVLDKWSLLNADEGSQNWRPSGWQIATGADRELYVIMGPDGFDGSHKSGAERIWVYSLKSKKKIREIKAETAALSLELLNTKPRLLAVTNVNMGLDIYDTKGSLQRSMTVGDVAMPFVLHGVRQ